MPDVLSVPRGALAASSHDEPDRVAVRLGSITHERGQAIQEDQKWRLPDARSDEATLAALAAFEFGASVRHRAATGRKRNQSRAEIPENVPKWFTQDLQLPPHNRQRIKSRAELTREAIIDLDADECHRKLRARREAEVRVSADRLDIGPTRRRHRISKAKFPFLRAIQRVIDERRNFWPLSDRMVHYALLNEPPLTHARKPSSRYTNSFKCYRSVVELLTRARLTGEVPFAAIHDPTRPVTHWETWPGVGQHVSDGLNGLFSNYARNLMQSQPNHIEIIVEKNTVEPIIRTVASEYTIPITSGRGYSSLPPRYDIFRRFRNSGKSKLILVFVSDLDPEGENIAESFARSLRDDFGLTDDQLHPIKASLTHDQVQRFKLPAGMKAKMGSSRRRQYVEKYGENVWELEALEPLDLQRIVRETIESAIDVDAFNTEVKLEAEDSRYLESLRRDVVKRIREFADIDEHESDADDEL
jgi:hypothetical protein